MCTVQVLLVTDVIGPSAIRDVRPMPPRSICRRLFADEDATKPRPSQLLSALHEGIERQNRERWNFDFRTGTPMPGRYQWTPLLCPVADRAPPRDTEVPQTATIPAEGRRQTSKKTQSKITDFLIQRKRHRTAVVDLDLPSSKLKFRRLQTETGIP